VETTYTRLGEFGYASNVTSPAADSVQGTYKVDALSLSAPFEPLRHIGFIGMGCAYFAAERYDRAVQWVRSGVEAFPESFWAQRIAVAAASLMGARAEARRMGRRLMRKDPDLTTSEARQAWPFTPAFMSRLGHGLEMAGLPRG
jgi:hypothetical protein